jgi:hypothetical protein
MFNGLLIAGIGAAAIMMCIAGPEKRAAVPADNASVYDFSVADIDGHQVKLSKYKGDVMLIVNVASR